MGDMYVLTLALSIGIALVMTAALVQLSKTQRLFGLFHIRGVQEKPRWGGVVFLAAFALTPFVASAISSEASELVHAAVRQLLGIPRGDVARVHRRVRRRCATGKPGAAVGGVRRGGRGCVRGRLPAR